MSTKPALCETVSLVLRHTLELDILLNRVTDLRQEYWKDLNQIIDPFSENRDVSGLPQPMFKIASRFMLREFCWFTLYSTQLNGTIVEAGFLPRGR